MEYPPFLLLSLLVVTFSSQIHARESKFFSKTVRLEVSPTSIAQEPSPSELALPPQSHNGYGLYGHDVDPADQFPSTTTTTTSYNFDTNHAYTEPNSIPSSSTNAGFSAQNDEKYERNYYDNNDSLPSTTNSEFPSSSDDRSYERKVSNNPYYGYQDRYGMSDTRFMESGNYFNNVNKENYDEPMNSGINIPERSYGSSYANNNYGENTRNRNNGYDHEYKNDLDAYLNSKENQESKVGFNDP